MESDTMEEQRAGVAPLHQEFRDLLAGPRPFECEALHRILLHPVSRLKLQTACATVLRRTAGRRDLVADVKQEAFALVIARFQEGDIPYRDDGPARFGGWLWVLWYRACREAWRRLRPRIPECQLAFEPYADEAGEDVGSDARWHRILTAIDGFSDRDVREVLLDLVEGVSCEESARRHGISRSTVCRRRHRGCAALRSIVGPSCPD